MLTSDVCVSLRVRLVESRRATYHGALAPKQVVRDIPGMLQNAKLNWHETKTGVVLLNVHVLNSFLTAHSRKRRLTHTHKKRKKKGTLG